jgi:adenine-specific DNA glycosylase
LVALGQSYCTAKNPRCSTCPIAHLCKYISHPTNSSKALAPSSSSSISSTKNVTSVKKPKAENKSLQAAASTVKRRSDESSSLSHPPTFKSRKHIIVVPQV